MRPVALGVLLAALALSGGMAASANADPFTWSGPVPLDTTGMGTPMKGAVCPTDHLCVAGDYLGQIAIFDPQAATSARQVLLAPDRLVPAVACASATQCTAITSGSPGDLDALTFDPTADRPEPSRILLLDSIVGLGSNGITLSC